MRSIILSAVASFLVATSAQADPSACKGLDTTACSSNSACTWRQALVAGETITKAGTAAKRNVKAHCRKGPAAKGAPQKQSAAAERT